MMAFNAGDRKDVVRAEKAAALVDRNRIEVLANIAKSEAGRRYLWDELAACHVFNTVFSDDPHRTYYLEGQRSRGLALLDVWMQAAPDSFILAMREANGRRTEPEPKPSASGANGQRPSGEEPGRVDQGYASDAESFPEAGAEA